MKNMNDTIGGNSYCSDQDCKLCATFYNDEPCDGFVLFLPYGAEEYLDTVDTCYDKKEEYSNTVPDKTDYNLPSASYTIPEDWESQIWVNTDECNNNRVNMNKNKTSIILQVNLITDKIDYQVMSNEECVFPYDWFDNVNKDNTLIDEYDDNDSLILGLLAYQKDSIINTINILKEILHK